MTSRNKLKYLLPVPIIMVSLLLFGLMMKSRKTADTVPVTVKPEAVESIELRAGSAPIHVRGTGVVEGEREVRLSALVGGPVRMVSDKLVPGARVAKGELLLKIEARDYELALEQQSFKLRQAELELELEQERASSAKREWQLLGEGRDPSAAPLALRGPQLETAESRVAAAQAALDASLLSLKRTALRAPFEALVLSESAQEGQLLAPGNPVVTLVGTEMFRVRVSVAVDQLQHVALPDSQGSGGAVARVVQELADGSVIEREGRVLRLAGKLDPQTRRAELHIGIEAPLDVDGLPMLPGAFVTVRIEGSQIPGAIEIPVVALDGTGAVWTVNGESTLVRRQVTLAWRDEQRALVTSGLAVGERIVVSPLALPVEGASVRLVDNDAAEELD